jgi:DNA-binding NtrC family response regulator
MSDDGKFRILVVDDEASVLTTYRLILERQGYNVMACHTWREAMSAIEGQDFDAVLCDYSLEERHTGCEVIHAARKRDATLPAALITGYANKETADEAALYNIGMMFKPIEIEEFLDTTARMLRRNHELSQQTGQEDGAGPQSAVPGLSRTGRSDRRER